MIGVTSAGIEKPFWDSQSFRALASVAWSCTVSYGPTFCCFVTVTAPFGPAVSEKPEALELAPHPPPPEQSLGALGQVRFGGVICVAVSSSIESKRTSALRPTVTVAPA